jgi:hypothetical protein
LYTCNVQNGGYYTLTLGDIWSGQPSIEIEGWAVVFYDGVKEVGSDSEPQQGIVTGDDANLDLGYFLTYAQDKTWQVQAENGWDGDATGCAVVQVSSIPSVPVSGLLDNPSGRSA